MSLVSDIRANTANVRLAKLALAQAIVNKGSSVGDYANVPTFSNIILGVNNILSVKDISGVTEVNILASENLVRGDLCDLAKVMTDKVLTGTYDTPLTLVTYTGSTKSVDHTGIIAVLNDGEIIFLSDDGDYEYGTSAYPFIRTENGYEQLKLRYNANKQIYFRIYLQTRDFSYKTYQMPLQTVYDKNADRVLCYCSFYTSGVSGETADFTNGTTNFYMEIDRENKWLIPHHIYNTSGSKVSDAMQFLISGGNGLIFYNKKYSNTRAYHVGQYFVVDPETDTCTVNPQTIDSLLGVTLSLGANVAVDAATVGNGTLLITKESFDTNYASSSAYRISYLKVANGGVSKAGSVRFLQGNVYSTSTITNSNCGEYLVPRVCVNNNCFVFAIDASTTLHTYIYGLSDASLLEFTPVFSDGLDITKISFCRCTKEDDYLYLISTDEAYSAEEQHRLYQYDATSNTFVFVCCPPLNSSPAVQALVPRNRTAGYNNIGSTCFLAADGNQRFYDLPKQEFEYTATKSTANRITGANAYGVAMENISSGSTGKATVILKA